MKYIVVVPDGMADKPIESLEGKTPLEASKTPNFNYFAKMGKVGLVQTTPPGLTAASDVCNMALLGYDAAKYYSGRAPLEAASMGVKLEPDEIAFRCNFITEFDGKMADYSAGHISSHEAKVLIEYLDSKLGNERVRFHPGISYRHLLILKAKRGSKEFSADCTPPHDIIGKPIASHFPQGDGAEFLKEIMLKAKSLIQNHEINIIRADLKENPANMIWLWSQGVMPALEKFKDKFGLQGGLISAVDLVNGIGKIAGLEVIKVPGATGYFDTDYAAKARYGLESLKRNDFIFIHIEATDEAGHCGNLNEKIRAIESIDFHIMGPIREYMKANPDTRLFVAPDHPTPVDLRTHTNDPVPVLFSGAGIEADEIETYGESAAQYSTLKFEEGHQLMEYFIERA